MNPLVPYHGTSGRSRPLRQDMAARGAHTSLSRRLLAALLLLGTPLLPAQETGPDKIKPPSHAQNQERAARADAANLKQSVGHSNLLVLPGLVADKARRRVEVMVESTQLGPNAACEFTIVSETSDHAYEALLIAFAQPSAVDRALHFIGLEPGESFDPGSLRFWAKGERVVLSLLWTSGPAVRLEKLLVDRRTGQTLREDGFMFTGSRMVPSIRNPRQPVYAADEYQPKAIVSLFNSTYSVLEVPYAASKDAVYQNTIVNPALELPADALLTLVLEPAARDGSKRVQDLALRVQAGPAGTAQPPTGLEGLTCLRFELKAATTVLNRQPNLISVVEALATLDRTHHDYYLTVSFEDKVELGQAQAVARILSTLDSEKGIRVDPPPPGQLYYRAFTPDPQLLDRAARMYHPRELSLTEKDGQVAGRLFLMDSVWKKGAAASELEVTERTVSSSRQLGQELRAEAERARQADQMARPPVLLVFAPARLQYGLLAKFLEPALSTHQAIHVYLDLPMPPLPNPGRAHSDR